ncbi:hypothetical protein E3V33_04140 [Candidatus Marinimicrobia bacterium MT.SAG.4]|nr:hypothetical protein E3V33_04140 [Candidatus Marinimicrobia bacterium MT.SAG.4]
MKAYWLSWRGSKSPIKVFPSFGEEYDAAELCAGRVFDIVRPTFHFTITAVNPLALGIYIGRHLAPKAGGLMLPQLYGRWLDGILRGE